MLPTHRSCTLIMDVIYELTLCAMCSCFWSFQVCLLGQISAKSDAFLEGLETTHALRRHVTAACKSVKQLRSAMHRVQREVVDKAMLVPQLA